MTDPLLTPVEKASLKAMSLEEVSVTGPLTSTSLLSSFPVSALGPSVTVSAVCLQAKMRRAELQRARALQSYYEAKARREKKIKSKK